MAGGEGGSLRVDCVAGLVEDVAEVVPDGLDADEQLLPDFPFAPDENSCRCPCLGRVITPSSLEAFYTESVLGRAKKIGG